MDEGLKAVEVMNEAYKQLLERNPHKTIEFSQEPRALVANDFDTDSPGINPYHFLYHMVYDKLDLVEIGDKRFALGIGKPVHDFHFSPVYSGDIIALETSNGEELAEGVEQELSQKVEDSKYFRNTIMLVLHDGQIHIPRVSRFFETYRELVPESITLNEDNIASKMKIHPDLFNPSTLGPVVTQSIRYKPHIVELMSKSIEETLLKI